MTTEPSIPTEPVALLVGLVVVFFFVPFFIRRRFSKWRRKRWARNSASAWRQTARNTGFASSTLQSAKDGSSAQQRDAADQLRVVMHAEFSKQPLLNKSEARVSAELTQAVNVINPTWHVTAQVSLGEIVSSNDPNAYWCINSKRVDLLLMDGDYQPRHAIEYQGGAHYQGTSAARDAIKREALRRAGIGYHEVVAGFTTPIDLRRLVEKLVERPGATPLV
jgi:hypothetical protein